MPDEALLTALRAFRTMPRGAALAAWFGPRLAALLADADALRAALAADICEIEAQVAQQLDSILHHPRLLRLEGSWRGLHWLVAQIDQRRAVRLCVMNVSWHEMEDDFDRPRSSLSQKVYEAEFATAGGEPFGLLVVDEEVRARSRREWVGVLPREQVDDCFVLRNLAMLGAAAFAPIVVGAAPELLDVEAFTDLAQVADPASPLAADKRHDAERDHWHSMTTQDSSRFLAVVVPHVLARPPWTDDGTGVWCDDVTGVEDFHYNEYAPTAAERVWMNAGYAFASVVARAVAEFGWPADVRGADTDRLGGGIVSGLPAEPFQLSATLNLPRLPIDLLLLDVQTRALREAGMMPLTALPFGEELLFSAVPSLYRPPPGTTTTAVAAANDWVASQFNVVLCASRFAHYIKAKGRSSIGRFRDAPTIEMELQRWLRQFVNNAADSSAEMRARRPLRGATVKVTESPGRPGTFICRVHLEPYFQIDEVAASFRFETELASESEATAGVR